MDMQTWIIDAIEEKIQKLEAENARLREMLEHIYTLGKMYEEKASAQVASEAFKEENQ
jgi:cell shape-determining protein MreC